MTDRTGPLLAVSAVLVAVAVIVPLIVTGAVVRGVVIGTALGLVNLLIGSRVVRQMSADDPQMAMAGIAVGFTGRFVVLVALLALFTFVPATGVSVAAFGFTFVGFVFVNFAVEAASALRLQRQEAA